MLGWFSKIKQIWGVFVRTAELINRLEEQAVKLREQDVKLRELEERIDRTEWDWHRFKKAQEAKNISEAIKRLEAEDDQQKRQQIGEKGFKG